MRANLRIAALAATVALLLPSHSCSIPRPIDSVTAPSNGETPQWVTAAVEAHGVQHRTFWSEAVGQQVSYHIFVPVPYDSMHERRFPVLYWLHGAGGGLDGIAPLSLHFAQAMQAGKMPLMLVVFPNGLDLSMWVDAKDGSIPVETIVIHELIPHIDGAFRTIASRDGRIVEGFSMGGYGAARFGFRHHHLFWAVSILAGGPLQREFTESPRADPQRRERVFRDVFGGDMDYFRALSPWILAEENADLLAESTRIRLVIGELDEMLEVNQRFHEHLTELEIPYEYLVIPGVGHAPMPLRDGLGEEGWCFYWRDNQP